MSQNFSVKVALNDLNNERPQTVRLECHVGIFYWRKWAFNISFDNKQYSHFNMSNEEPTDTKWTMNLYCYSVRNTHHKKWIQNNCFSVQYRHIHIIHSECTRTIVKCQTDNTSWMYTLNICRLHWIHTFLLDRARFAFDLSESFGHTLLRF